MAQQGTQVSKGIFYLGTFGNPEIISTYLVQGKELALIESGPPRVASSVVSSIKDLGFNPKDVSHIVVSHVHIDHAGGAGDLLKEMPNAEVVAFEPGVKHLVDPSRLIASARVALGEILDYWGEPQPVPRQRIRSVQDGDTLDLGGPFLRFITAPGHAPHEMAVVEEGSRGLFTGDTVGIYRTQPTMLTPSSPPPSFDYQLAMKSIRRLKESNPSVAMLPHYRYWKNAQEILDLNLSVYTRWARIIQAAAGRGGIADVAKALLDEFPEYRALADESHTRKLLEMNIAGFMQCYEKNAFR